MVLIKSKPETLFNDSFFPGSFNSVLRTFFDEGRQETQAFDFMPAADIVDHSDSFEIRMSLPGIKKEEVKISLDGDRLTIEGERREEQKSETSKFLKKEIRYGKFSRTFVVGKADANGVEAVFENGLLSVSIKKKAEEKAALINIK